MNKGLLIPDTPLAEKMPPRPKWSLRRFLLINKLASPLGYLLLFLLCSAMGVGIAFFGMKVGILLLGAMAGIPILVCFVLYPRLSIPMYIVMAYFIMLMYKIGIDFPMGTLMDGLEGLFILGIFIQQKITPDWKMFKGSVSTMVLIWIGYNLIEVANPSAESRLAWVYTVRSVALAMLNYFVFVYNIRTKAFIKIIIKLWLGLSFFAALYAYKQQHIGFFGFEDAYLHSDPYIENLLFIGGVWRKFSIFSDPVAFSYNMVVSSLLCIGLLTGPLSIRKKALLVVFILFYVSSMLYSGTRGAYVLIPAALLIFAILKYNKKVMTLMAAMGVIFIIIIYIPTSNYTLYRFQSAFKPSDDASFNLRKINQKRIQPYIISHPLGGGLGATGKWGLQFAPNSYLAHFPPDSGYVRVAVELGWVGLFIMLLLMYTILKTGINNYYRIKDPELKSYCLSMILIVFAYHIGNYPQEALVQYPSNILFYLAVAMLVVVMRIDNQQNGITDEGK